MKKIVLIFLLFIGLKSIYAQSIEFEIQFSENYATFEFLRNISENYPDNAFKKVFEGSKYNTPEHKALIEEFNSINYFYWYEYEQYPYGNKIGGSTYFILGRNLITSKTLEEFKAKSYGIIPNNDLDKFYKILSKFLPIYREVVYKPSKEKFDKQLSNVRKLISKTDMNRLFQKALTIHQSTWDFNLPFYVTLYPIPDQRTNGFTATAFYNIAIGGIPQGLNDFELLLSVMFHEAFHIVYDEQPLTVKQEIASWFKKNTSHTAQYAQLLFNEAVTTSLAQGYLYEEIKRNPLKKPWYNNPFISEMAEAMYPMVEEYIVAKKPIDEVFIKNYIDLFDTKFKHWIKNFNHLTMNRFVISESGKSYGTLYNAHPYANISEYKNELNSLTIEEMKSHPVTKIVIVTKDNKTALDLIKNSFVELKDWNPNTEKEFVFSQFLNDKTYLVILNSKTENISGLLENLSIE